MFFEMVNSENNKPSIIVDKVDLLIEFNRPPFALFSPIQGELAALCRTAPAHTDSQL